MAPLLIRLNEKPFHKLAGIRAIIFAGIDAPALLPLPLQRCENARFKTVKVHIDHHVEVERHRYRVPQTLSTKCWRRAPRRGGRAVALRPASRQPCARPPCWRLPDQIRARVRRALGAIEGMDARVGRASAGAR